MHIISLIERVVLIVVVGMILSVCLPLYRTVSAEYEELFSGDNTKIKDDWSRSMRKRVFWHMRTAMEQISLHIRTF